MDDTIKIIIVNLITTSGLLGIFIFILKRILQRIIDLKYDQKLEEFKKDLDIIKKYKEFIADKRMDIFPILSELTYRSRNISRQIINHYKQDWKSCKNEIHALQEELFTKEKK